MYYFKISPHELDIMQGKDGWWILKHKDPARPLWFKLRHNANINRLGEPDNMMEFEIYDGAVPVGKGAQFTRVPNEWTQRFIFEGYFNVWMSGRKRG